MPDTDNLHRAATDPLANDMGRNGGQLTNAAANMAAPLWEMLQFFDKGLQSGGMSASGERCALTGDKRANFQKVCDGAG